MYECFDKFSIEYQKVTNTIHPTKLTERNGKLKTEIDDSGAYSNQNVAGNYLFEDFFYDSHLEKENIQTELREVIVFTKIPKNSIKIPVAGGKSYSPDFAYVLNFENGVKKLYFIVETKNAEEESLRNEELQKIKHAEKFFGDTIKIQFETQFSNKKMSQLIGEIYKKL
jgi:type III restriction enzyme